jgi:nitrogen PTS system EIIA component
MPYTDLLAADRIVLLVAPGNRDAVLDAAARLLCDGSPHTTQAIAGALRAREDIGSTGIGRGVAIPHCRGGVHRDTRAAFLRLSAPVDFGALDGEPVDLVFAMSAPEDGAQQHLDTLSELASTFADAGFRDALRGARNLPALRRLLLERRGGREGRAA